MIEQADTDVRRPTWNARLGPGALAVIAGLALAMPSTAAADDVETFTVNAGGDAGDGVCEAAAGECTLRDAMIAAEDADTTDLDTIVFDPGVTGTITITGAQLPMVDEPLNVNGPGAGTLTVSGGFNFKIFETSGASTALTIAGLTLSGGNGSATFDGGAVVNNGAQVTLDEAAVTTSQPAAVYNDGSLTVTDSEISSNPGRGIQCGPAATTTSVVRSLIADNELFSSVPPTGGGIACGGIVTVEESTISGNDTAEEGAGIFAASATVTIEDSTIADNTSLDHQISAIQGNRDGLGGGISAFSTDLTIRNSTISGNTAQEVGNIDSEGFGGGIYSYASSTVEVYDSTIAGNTSGAKGGGVMVESAQPHSLANTIVGDNTAPMGPDLYTEGVVGADVDLSFTLIENATGATIHHAVPGSNITGVDPQLGAPSMNGGPTMTQRPSNTSPALDQGSSSATTDQRGMPREVDLLAVPNSMALGADASDIGSVELSTAEGPAPPQIPPPTTNSPVMPTPAPGVDLAAAIRRCKKKFEKGTKARKRCIRRARQQA
jgi:parallel beta helix pectate lyase-like protein